MPTQDAVLFNQVGHGVLLPLVEPADQRRQEHSEGHRVEHGGRVYTHRPDLRARKDRRPSNETLRPRGVVVCRRLHPFQKKSGGQMTKTMLAARLREFGKPFSLEEVPVPAPRPTDVLISVRACNVVPNLANVITHYSTWFPYLPLPKLPATFGLDVSGVVAEVGSQVLGIAPGDRVYVNPQRSCGGCKACRSGEPIACDS